MRRLLEEWTAIDWFVPPAAGAEAQAAELLREHQRRGRRYAPDLFESDIRVETIRGDARVFSDLCARVRGSSGWDWKYSALKPLSSRHSKDRGWSPADAAVDITQDRLPRPGDLFMRVGEATVWNDIGPRLDLSEAWPKDEAEAARFYIFYAMVDAMEGVCWQVAEPTADLFADNPFMPLVRCYATGGYPFALGAREFVLFAFR